MLGKVVSRVDSSGTGAGEVGRVGSSGTGTGVGEVDRVDPSGTGAGEVDLVDSSWTGASSTVIISALDVFGPSDPWEGEVEGSIVSGCVWLGVFSW